MNINLMAFTLHNIYSHNTDSRTDLAYGWSALAHIQVLDVWYESICNL